MYADGGSGTVGLVALYTVDVDDPFLAVDLGDLSLTALVLATDDSDFVVFSDGKRTGVVFSTEFFRKGRGHYFTTDGRGRREMVLARLAP